MKRECLKCGSTNTMAKGGALEACPVCGAVYDKVEAAKAGSPKPSPAPKVAAAKTATTPVRAAPAVEIPKQPPVDRNMWVPPTKKPTSPFTWLVLVIIGIYGVGRVVSDIQRPSSESPRAPSQSTPEQKQPKTVLWLSGTDMLQGYRTNEVREDARHEGKLIRTSGTVKSVTKSAFGGMMIRFDIGDPRSNIVINAADNQTQAVAELSPGGTAEATCDHFSFILGDPVGYDCEISH